MFLKNACLDWYFARHDKLSDQDIVRRRAAFKLSQSIREEIADTDKWKIMYVLEMLKRGMKMDGL
jgi:hypothetical protein